MGSRSTTLPDMSSSDHEPSEREESIDYVDHLLEQWGRRRPDIDVSAMAVFGRITRAERFVARSLESVFARHGLQKGRFDVLAALRRAGPPYILSPTGLYNSLLVSSGAMSNRLERLEADGLIERIPDPHDGRGKLVRLSEKGGSLLDSALGDHVANELEMIKTLSASDRGHLAALLQQLLVAFGDTGEPQSSRSNPTDRLQV